MGGILRGRDWNTTARGKPHAWPQGLQGALRLMLNTRHPVHVFWGPRHHCFYNDAYANHLLSRSALSSEQRERVSEVSSSAKHLLGLIDDILDPSKVEAGKLVLAASDFGSAELLESTIAMVSEQARAKGLVLSVDAAALPRVLRGDRLRLSQMILNLLSHAVKFTEVGSVVLRARGAR